MIKQKTMSYPLILFFWPTSEKWPAAHLRAALPRPSSVRSALGPWASSTAAAAQTRPAAQHPERNARSPAPRPQPGPGPGIRRPAWASFSPANRGHAFWSDGHAWLPRDQNPARRSPLPKTLAHFCLPFSPSALLTPPASRRKGAQRTVARKGAFGGRGWRRREALRRCTRAAARGPVEWPCDRRPFGSSSRTREHKTAAARLPDLDWWRARIGDRQRRRASFSPRDGGCDGDERTR